MDLSTLHENLLPCDMDSPFVFVSYSSADREVVWTDVSELQQRGYNVWIDEANLDKSKDSWKEDALRAIEDYNCELLLFYVSHNSLTSEPCLNELEKTIDGPTQETHLGRVEYIAIDAENVGNMGAFIQKISTRIESSGLSSAEKSQMTRVLFHFKTKWFQENNEKVRIHPKAEPNRITDYYSDIEREFGRNRREVRLPPDKLRLRVSSERLYRYAIECIIKNRPKYAKVLLEAGAPLYTPPAFLLAHIYYTGGLDVPEDADRAKRIWDEIERKTPVDQWKKAAIEYDRNKFYSEAVACFLAYGERKEDPESLFMASKMWLKKGCQSQALIALRLSARMGSDKARGFLSQLYSYDEEEVYKHAFRDEAPVK